MADLAEQLLSIAALTVTIICEYAVQRIRWLSADQAMCAQLFLQLDAHNIQVLIAELVLTLTVITVYVTVAASTSLSSFIRKSTLVFTAATAFIIAVLISDALRHFILGKIIWSLLSNTETNHCKPVDAGAGAFAQCIYILLRCTSGRDMQIDVAALRRMLFVTGPNIPHDLIMAALMAVVLSVATCIIITNVYKKNNQVNVKGKCFLIASLLVALMAIICVIVHSLLSPRTGRLLLAVLSGGSVHKLFVVNSGYVLESFIYELVTSTAFIGSTSTLVIMYILWLVILYTKDGYASHPSADKSSSRAAS